MTVVLFLPLFMSFREKYLELKKLHENEEGEPEKGKHHKSLPLCIPWTFHVNSDDYTFVNASHFMSGSKWG